MSYTEMVKSASDRQYSDEGTLLRKVKEWLEPQRREGVKLIRICDRYTKGYSDLFICVRGWFVVAELKDDTGSASRQQIDFVDDMVDCGAIGRAECRSVRDVAELVERAKIRADAYWATHPDENLSI